MRKPRLKNAADLRSRPHIAASDLDAAAQVAERYAIGVTSHVMDIIDGPPGEDPVAAQYIPRLEELKTLPGEDSDPIGDNAHSPVKGIVHRYSDRVLLKAANVCSVYCRYCFRRDMIGPGSQALKPAELTAALDYIRANPKIWEVILTGGDPLVLSPRQLGHIMRELNAIDHVQVIRIHTRVPLADPAKIDDALCAALETDKALYVALHINHGREITTQVKDAIVKLRRVGCTLLSQSVLLKGVNNCARTLEELFRMLVTLRVKPYYLHHPDLAPGTSHFRLDIAEGQAIIKELQGRVSGLCMPHYMLDIPGGHGKIPVGPVYAHRQDDGTYNVEDMAGNRHLYSSLLGEDQ